MAFRPRSTKEVPVSCDCLNAATGEPCPQDATATCHGCRKRICALHTDQDGEHRPYCPDCALGAGVATCREKVGFLSVRDCKQQAAAKCTGCQCPLCQDHAVATAKGVLCSTCAAQTDARPAEGSGYRRNDYRRYYYSDYEPYYWGSDWRHRDRWRSHGSHYDDRDTQIFDEHKNDDAAAAAATAGGLERDDDFGAS